MAGTPSFCPTSVWLLQAPTSVDPSRETPPQFNRLICSDGSATKHITRSEWAEKTRTCPLRQTHVGSGILRRNCTGGPNRPIDGSSSSSCLAPRDTLLVSSRTRTVRSAANTPSVSVGEASNECCWFTAVPTSNNNRPLVRSIPLTAASRVSTVVQVILECTELSATPVVRCITGLRFYCGNENLL